MYRDRKNFMILVFWHFPIVWAMAAVQELSNVAAYNVTVARKQGLGESEIYKLARQFLQYSPLDIEIMVVRRKKQKLRRLLEDYHALGNAIMGIRYDKDRVMGGYPLDIPRDVILKIAIDRAIKKLGEENWRLAAIIVMKYINQKSSDRDIRKLFNIADRTKRKLISSAISKLLRIIETGSSISPIQKTINLLKENTNFPITDIRKITIQEYNKLKIQEWNKKNQKINKKNRKKVEVIHKSA